MTGVLNDFCNRLQSIKKMHKTEKYAKDVQRALREKINEVIQLDIGQVLQVLKAIMLVRHVDRSIREKSIRAIK